MQKTEWRTRISGQFLFLCNVMPDRMVLRQQWSWKDPSLWDRSLTAWWKRWMHSITGGRGGNDGASKIARSPIHDQEAGSSFVASRRGGGREVSLVLSPQQSQVKGFGAGVSLPQEASPSMTRGNESGHGPSIWMNSVKTHIGRFFWILVFFVMHVFSVCSLAYSLVLTSLRLFFSLCALFMRLMLQQLVTT